jgi:thiol-disulfide isomerase/thioredoxin
MTHLRLALPLVPLLLALPPSYRAAAPAGPPAERQPGDNTPAVALGKAAPPLHLRQLLQAPADAPRTLDQLKGKAVVLEFWGTWCAPCIAAFPHLNELVKDCQGEPVVFISVTDEPADLVVNFLKTKTLATWVGIDDRGATTSGYGVQSWPTTVLIDPDGIVRGVTWPHVVTAALLKDLAHRRPLKAAAEGAPRLRTDQQGGLDLGQAEFLLYLGPPNALLGNPTVTPTEARSPRVSARQLLQSCYVGEAGGPFKSPRVVFECDLPEKEFGYAVRLPKGSGLSPSRLLQEALESSLGFRTRGEREQRDQDVLVLKHIGPAAPAKAGGNPALGSRLMFPPNTIVGEGAHLRFLAQWIERNLKKPVLDETGLSGEYDWKIKVESFDEDDVNTALKDLGLALTPERRKVEYIVVRRLNEAAGK